MEFIDVLIKMEIDPQETIRRFCQNEAMLKKYLLRFGDEATYPNLVKAIEEKDHEEVEKCAHTLKGLSANLGMNKLSEKCAKIVSAMREGEYDKLDTLFPEVEAEYKRLNECLEELK
ncbi:Hpt domain-containing protein [[Clostridium] hylemonae]|uniref:Hpt domain-containing protein n=1 Tax=[Clostridium] hylemonae TaxID=89153 RepID=UPI0011070AF2|nr:Hpt domain-containing protein [[Clostridium] hylemonae]